MKKVAIGLLVIGVVLLSVGCGNSPVIGKVTGKFLDVRLGKDYHKLSIKTYDVEGTPEIKTIIVSADVYEDVVVGLTYQFKSVASGSYNKATVVTDFVVPR